MRNFGEYDIWVDGIALVSKVHDLVDEFSSNRAEGASRSSEKDVT